MEAYIYTYVNRETKKTYIGARYNYNGSCYDDFNIKYFSSSKDKEFRQDMADDKLDGQIVFVMNADNANKKIFEVEAKMIEAYWAKYGKENSYNHYAKGNWSTAGMKFPGRTYSEEHKKHLSEVHKGRPGFWRGKHLYEETKKKLSESHKGRTASEETKRKMSEAQKGKVVSEETRRKKSEAAKGKHPTEEIRKKLSKIHKLMPPPFKGKHHTDESILKYSKPVCDDKGNFFVSINKCAEFYNRSPRYILIRLQKGIFTYAR